MKRLILFFIFSLMSMDVTQCVHNEASERIPYMAFHRHYLAGSKPSDKAERVVYYSLNGIRLKNITHDYDKGAWHSKGALNYSENSNELISPVGNAVDPQPLVATTEISLEEDADFLNDIKERGCFCFIQ